MNGNWKVNLYNMTERKLIMTTGRQGAIEQEIAFRVFIEEYIGTKCTEAQIKEIEDEVNSMVWEDGVYKTNSETGVLEYLGLWDKDMPNGDRVTKRNGHWYIERWKDGYRCKYKVITEEEQEELRKYKGMKELLLTAPKLHRTHCYCQKPITYEIICPICKSHNITWSEYEKHIWCYDCEKDVLITLYSYGVFSGPIPVDIATSLGMSFDRVSMKGEVVKFKSDEWNDSWVRDEKLYKHIKNYELQYKIKHIPSAEVLAKGETNKRPHNWKGKAKTK